MTRFVLVCAQVILSVCVCVCVCSVQALRGCVLTVRRVSHYRTSSLWQTDRDCALRTRHCCSCDQPLLR